MDAAALTAVLNNSPGKLSTGKKDVQKATDGFETILQGFGTKSKKDIKTADQDINAVLLQLLALINMMQCSDETCGTEGGENDTLQRNSLLTQIAASLSDNAEISRLWKELTSSFSSEGKFDEITAAKFYQALKSSVPEMSKLDIDTFLEQLKNVLNQKSDNQNFVSGNANAAKGPIAADESFERSQTGEAQESVKQSDSIQLSPVKNGKISGDIQADSGTEGMKTKDVKMGNGQDSAKATDIAKTGSDAAEGMQTEKTISNTLKSDIPILESFLGEVSAGAKTGVNEKAQMLQDAKPFTVETFEHLVDNIRLAIKDGTRELSLKIKPDNLGNVMIKIFSDGDKLTAELFVENAYVHEAIQYHAQELKNQIQQHGYNLTEVNVYQTSDWQAGSFSSGEFQQKNDYRLKKYKYNYRDEESQVEEIAAKSMYEGWGNTGSINYVV